MLSSVVPSLTCSWSCGRTKGALKRMSFTSITVLMHSGPYCSYPATQAGR